MGDQNYCPYHDNRKPLHCTVIELEKELNKAKPIVRETILGSLFDGRHQGLQGLDKLWRQTKGRIDRTHKIVRVGVWFGALVKRTDRQQDLFHVGVNDKWETISQSIDHLNWRYGKTSVSIGPWDLKYGNHLGTKIAFTRIPRREDAI